MKNEQPKRDELLPQNRQIYKTKGKHSTYIKPQNQNKSSELDLLLARGNAYKTTKTHRNWELISTLRTNEWDHCLKTAHFNIYEKLIKRKQLQANTEEKFELLTLMGKHKDIEENLNKRITSKKHRLNLRSYDPLPHKTKMKILDSAVAEEYTKNRKH